MSQYYRLPNKEVTQNINEYAQAWKELGDDVQAFLNQHGSNAVVMGFDPGIFLQDTRLDSNGNRVYDSIHTDAGTRLSNEVALAIQRAYHMTKV